MTPTTGGGNGGAAGRRAIGRQDVAIALALGLLSFIVFNANLRAITAADTYAARYLPFSILQNHSVLLNPILDIVAQGRRVPTSQGQGARESKAFWIAKGEGDNYVSLYPIVVPVAIAPLYLPAVAFLDARGWDPQLVDQIARLMEKLCGSLIAASSVALLYLLLLRRGSPGTAAMLAIVYAFGTTTWVIGSQALWTHGLAELLIVATMLLITGQRSVARVAVAGLLCALIAANRPPDVVLAAALAVEGLWWAGRLAPLFIVAGLPPVVLTLAYNLLAVGHIGGAYALIARPEHYNDDVLGGVAGLLFSPTRGLFVFSPFLLFLPLLALRTIRRSGTVRLSLVILIAVMAQVVGYAMIDWRQGMCWGPRWLTDMLPLLMWLLAPIVTSLSRPARILFGATGMVAIAIQAIGAFWYTGASDLALYAGSGPDRMRPMWEIRNAAFVGALLHPPAPADLLRTVRGNIDLIEVNDDLAPSAGDGDTIGRVIDVAGWALTDERSPADIAVRVDGREIAGTGEFFTRPDVVRTLGVDSPAGWRVRFPLGNLAPGGHRVSVLVRADRGGEVRLLGERTFSLPADNPTARQERLLARAAQLALRRLGERQSPDGYWLTAFTSGPRFEHPQNELNTYLNAVLLDIAGPAAAMPGMQEILGRTRAFLTGQIEADGLVRYHGRPDAPTIGTLGCSITPDSDDTALVWRVAPSADRSLLNTALQTMGQFRREDGLYRTWLADRAAYQCLDPGQDPNPADIGIQLHILMLLAQADPPSAAALCDALARQAGDDALWVYYALAPLIVILRQAELDAVGCPLPLPPTRLRSDVPGQGPWVQAAQILREIWRGAATPTLYADASVLLRDLAANDFASVRLTPPLCYHNDLTATVRRFYWSEDLGYALWLTLYQEHQRLGSLLGCCRDE